MTTTPANGSITLKKLRIRGLGDRPSQWASAADCGELCWVWDFVASQNAPDWNAPWGNYSAGYNTTPNPTPGSGTYHSEVDLRATFGNALTINSVEIIYDMTKGSFVNNGVQGVVVILMNASNGIISTNALANNVMSNGTDLIHRATFASIQNVKGIVVYLRSAGVTSYPIASPGAGKIRQVKIRYTGSEIWQNGGPC